MSRPIATKKDFSCGGVVWDPSNRKLLLIYVENLSKTKVWTFPKGHPEANETDEQAALREVMEETGWTCEVVKPVLDSTYFYIRNGVRFHKTVRWFLMRPASKVGDFNPTEVIDCRWCSVDETKKLISYDSDIKLLQHLEKTKEIDPF